MKRSLLTVFFFVGLLADARAQTTWYVDAAAAPPGNGSAQAPYASLQYALAQPTTVGGDTLLVLPGVYAGAHDFLGKAVIVQSTAGALVTFLRGDPNASPTYSVVSFKSGEAPGTVLAGFTIEGGNGTLVGAMTLGGGVYIAGAWPMLIDCVVTNNHADEGGGVSATGGFASFRACTFEGNSANSGGGLELKNVLGAALVDCRLVHNQGGAVHALDCDVRLEGCEVAWNEASAPNVCAGVAVARSTLSMTRSTVHHNVSAAAPGGLSFFPTGPQWKATVTHCTFTRNAPSGIDAFGSFALSDSIVWGNSPIELFLTQFATVSWSNVRGGYAGIGNIDADPLFWLPDTGDLFLQPGSPCIDAGDPAGAPDPDGSRADMGALPFQRSHCPEPAVYCTAKMNSCGRLPAIAASGAPSASATSGFVVRTSGARAGKAGLLLYGTARANLRFEGGVLCIDPAGLRRGLAVFAAGGTGGACDAVLAIDWNAFAAGVLGGHPQAFLHQIGQRVDLQWWGRDTLAHGSLLSDALEYAVCP